MAVKTAPAILAVEYVLMISFQGLPFSTKSRCSVGNTRARALPVAGISHTPTADVAFAVVTNCRSQSVGMSAPAQGAPRQAGVPAPRHHTPTVVTNPG